MITIAWVLWYYKNLLGIFHTVNMQLFTQTLNINTQVLQAYISLKARDKNLTTKFTLYSSMHQWKLHFNGRRTNNQRLISGGKRNSTKSTLRRSFDQISFVNRAQYFPIKSISVWNSLYFQISIGLKKWECSTYWFWTFDHKLF